MKMGKYKLRAGLRAAAYSLGVAAVLLCFWTALRNMDAGRIQEGRLQLERSLRRAAVACYAEVGVYPATLEELTRYSGVQVDSAHYQVFYEVFADNLMPDITVLIAEV